MVALWTVIFVVLLQSQTFQMLLGHSCGGAPSNCRRCPYRTLDGSCNNLRYPGLGTPNSTYARLWPPKYCDGVQEPTCSESGQSLPNPRLVSYTVFGDADDPDPEFTLVNMQWGQIMTHDMSSTNLPLDFDEIPCCTEDGRLIVDDIGNETCFSILIPPDDPVYSESEVQCIQVQRTATDRDINCNYYDRPAEQLSIVTSFMDLSLVYGNSVEENREMRAFQGGRMLVEERLDDEWPPRSPNPTDDCDLKDPDEVCYLTGDTRANQTPGLTIFQIILLREHNRLADALAKLNPHWDDWILFEEARKINIAQHQYISYYEWLPIFLGTENMLYNGLIYDVPPDSFVNDYDPSVDPSVLNEHATAAFRFFHTQIQGRLDLVAEDRTTNGSLRLSDWFNRPGVIEDGDNFDLLTRGHATQLEQLTDINFDKEIKQYLFRGNMTLGQDLRSIDIQRNRDHGLASYNDLREYCGLERATEWKDFEDWIHPQIVQKLESLYEDPEDVDLTVGGSLEYLVEGTLAGPTFLCILIEQFFRTRAGDRYFFENEDEDSGFTSSQLQEIRNSSIARLMCDNGHDITSIQPQAFLSISESNPVVPCTNIPQVDLSQWIDNPSDSNY